MKKLLALVLALVMSMSLVTISNAAFKDADSIDYKEAVDVMNAVGVFVGDEKGNFNAKENLTREQAAKIIAYLELGSKAADALVGSGTFADVAASRWSAGFVGYCAQAGVVSGYDGKFDPAGQLTALQFGKMLLVEIGYDAKAAGMVGTDWAINTSKLMATTSLMKGIDGSVNQVLTREKAAQMTLNALKTPTVEYATKGSNITVNGAEINFGASTPTYVTNTIAKEQTISKDKLTNSGEYTIELGEKLYKDLKLVKDTTDAFERPTHEWYLKTTKIGAYAEAADLEYTAAVKVGTIYSDLGLSKGINRAKTTVYEDGARVTGGADDYDIVKGDITNKFGGNGAQTFVYYDDDAQSVTIVIINTYVAKIAAVRAATTTKDAYVVLNTGDSFTKPTSAVGNYETDAFAKDDIVAYTYSKKSGDDGVQSMYLTEKVTGVMSGYTTEGSVTVSGTKYNANTASKTKIAAFSATVDKGSDISVYLDKYGYGLYVDADTSAEYAVVLNYKNNAGDFNDTKKAELLFTDGTTKTVEVNLPDLNNDGTPDEECTTGNFEHHEDSKINKYDIVSYTVDSDKVYTLTLVADAYDGNAGGSFVLENGKNEFSLVKKTVVGGSTTPNVANVAGAKQTTSADGKTIFLVADTSGKKVSYSVYEGFANVPTIKHNGGAAGAVAVFMNSTSNGSPAKVVFIEKNARMTMTTDNKDVVFIKGSSSVGSSYTTALGTYFEYDAFVNGKEDTVKVTTAVGSDTLVYGPSYDTKGLLVLANCEGYVNASNPTYGDDMKYVIGTDSVVNDVIKLGGQSGTAQKAYAYASDVNVYYISVDGKLIASDITAIAEDVSDVVFLKTNDKGRLTEVYIRIVDETTTPGAPTSGHYSINLTNSHSSSTATVTVTNDQAASKNVTNVKVTMLNTASGTSATFDLANGTAASGAAYTKTFATVNTATYYVTATIDGVTLTSNTVIGG